MLLDRLPSSTKVSGQSIVMSSSFSSRCPLFRTSAAQRISLLITGNTHPNCAVAPYSDLHELADLVRKHVSALGKNS